MEPCPCGKSSYRSAHATYKAIDLQRKRQKSSHRGKGRMTRERTQIDVIEVRAYRCPYSGNWHMGHDGPR